MKTLQICIDKELTLQIIQEDFVEFYYHCDFVNQSKASLVKFLLNFLLIFPVNCCFKIRLFVNNLDSWHLLGIIPTLLVKCLIYSAFYTYDCLREENRLKVLLLCLLISMFSNDSILGKTFSIFSYFNLGLIIIWEYMNYFNSELRKIFEYII